MFLSREEQKKQERKTREALIAYGIAVEKITALVSKENPIKYKGLIKFEVAVFVYFRLQEWDVDFTQTWLYTAVRDHIATIGSYQDKFLDYRLNQIYMILHNQFIQREPSEISIFDFDDDGDYEDEDEIEYLNKLYNVFSLLLTRAIGFNDKLKWRGEWKNFIAIDNNSLSSISKSINLPVDSIEKILNGMDKFVRNPFDINSAYEWW